jgi:gluconolactonase
MKEKLIAVAIGIILVCGCQPKKELRIMGTVERLQPELDKLITADAKPEVLATGFKWSEGPVWAAKEKMLLFSDVPADTVFKWTEANGLEVYLSPSGFTGKEYHGTERGSNGLVIDKDGNLVLCQHGDRRIARMESPMGDPKPTYKTLIDNFRGKKFDSPNDAVFDHKGNLYFTDPPYGLAGHEHDSTKEAPYQGVYRLSPSGQITLLIDTLTKPNGIALSPDDQYLFIGNSDPDKAIWYRYAIQDTTLRDGKIFFDAASLGEQGSPDGMKIDRDGNLFASGPGGILIFSPEGKLIGRVHLPQATANCAFSEDEKTLFITSDSVVLRLKMR